MNGKERKGKVVMPRFSCRVCAIDFEVPQKALDKYKNWKPQYCRDHSPKRRNRSSVSKGSRPKRGEVKERRLSPAEVLLAYSGGPTTGVFTDGGCQPNPGPGGWGFVWVGEGEIIEEAWGAEAQTTNNRMELRAIIEALRVLPKDARLDIYSDSRLCVDTLTKWAAGWEKRGWRRKGGSIKNLELVQEAYQLFVERPTVKLRWIQAHSGDRWNEYADALASLWQESK